MMRIRILAVAAVVLLSSGCAHDHDKKHSAGRLTVTTPVTKDTVIFNEYVCQIQAIQHIEMRALEKGYLQNIYVDEGEFVRKGKVMFQIMPMIYQAELQKAEAEVKFAEIEYLNTKSLADSNIVSKNELALTRAKLDKAKAEVALAKAHLGFTRIVAPFDGMMDRFNVRLGSLVDEGELLTTLSDNSKMWVYFNVPEAEYLDYVMRSRGDESVQVKLKMANNRFFDHPGFIQTIEADFNNETGNIAFRAIFPNPDGILRHGETGNVLVPAVLDDALLIPQKATFEILDKKYVFVVGDDGTVKSREITIATEMPHLYAIRTGLTVRDKILVEGLRKVKNNQHIEYELRSQQQIIRQLANMHAE